MNTGQKLPGRIEYSSLNRPPTFPSNFSEQIGFPKSWFGNRPMAIAKVMRKSINTAIGHIYIRETGLTTDLEKGAVDFKPGLSSIYDHF